MKPVSLADISYEQGLKLLFLRKQALDEGVVQQLPPAALANSFIMNSTGTQVIKQAGGLLDALNALPGQAADFAKKTYNTGLDQITTDPKLRSVIGYGLAGAGAGALGAGGSAAARKEKNLIRRMLQGATAGGLLGGGVGLALNPESLTEKIEPAATKFIESITGLGTEPPKVEKITPEQAESIQTQRLKDVSDSSPGLGAAVPISLGAATSLGANKALKNLVPGMQGLDRRYIAQEWLNQFISDSSKVNAKKIQDALGSNALDKFTTTKITPYHANLFNVPNQAVTIPPNFTEADRQNMIKQIAKKIPLTVSPDEAGLADYFKDKDALKRVAENAKNTKMLSRASGSMLERLLKGNIGRRGIASIPSILGTGWGLSNYYQDTLAKNRAGERLAWQAMNKPAPEPSQSFKDVFLDVFRSKSLPQFDYTARDMTPEILYGSSGLPIDKDPSNINNASISSILRKKKFLDFYR